MRDNHIHSRKRAATFLWVAITIGLVACAADPGARRTRRVMSEEDEIKLGAEAAQQVEQYMGFSGSAELNAYVDRIGQRLAKQSSRSHLMYEFHVVDMAEPNAFALPGGHIYVSRGLLVIMNSEDELAAVLGHEVSHVLLRHGNERMSQSILADATVNAASVAAGGAAPAYQDMIVGGLGVGAQFGVLLPFSRKHESEADEVGQMFMAQAGFYPAEAITLWQNMAQQGGEAPKQWQSTHPSDTTRIQKLHANLPAAMQAYEMARAAGKDPTCEPPPDEWIAPEALP